MDAHTALAPLAHGGDLAAARRLFPGARKPFLDLSTGVNPHPYPVPELPPEIFTRLPEPSATEQLAGIAAKAYGAPSTAHIALASGSQILMALIARLVSPGRALVVGPTYAEHARALALAEHSVEEVTDIEQLGGADLGVVVNPNNPDGRVVSKRDLLTAADLITRRGLLIVDEAFMDAGPRAESVGGEVARGNIVVLRSFGKFFGLPGLRLSFALTTPEIAGRLNAALGPWPVSGAALAIGSRALADTAWAEAARGRLAKGAQRLDRILASAQLEIVGGTALFRLVQSPGASDLFAHLGRAGIFVRRFAERPHLLRFGLPGRAAEWQWLETAIASFTN